MRRRAMLGMSCYTCDDVGITSHAIDMQNSSECVENFGVQPFIRNIN